MDRSTNTHLVSLALLVTAVVLGLLVGSATRGQSGRSVASTSTESERLSALVPSTSQYASRIVAHAAKFEPGMSSHLLHLFQTMPLSEFPAMAELYAERQREVGSKYAPGVDIRALLEVWAERDPEAALAWYEDGMPPELNEHVRHGLFLGWGRSQPEAALAYIESTLEGSYWASGFVTNVFAGAAETNPDLAIRLLLAGGEKLSHVWAKVGFSIGRFQPGHWEEFLAVLPVESRGRQHAIAAVLGGVPDIEVFRALWEDLSDSDQAALKYSSVGRRLVQADVSGLSGEEFLEFYRARILKRPLDGSSFARAMAETHPTVLLGLISADAGELPQSLYNSMTTMLHNNHIDAATTQKFFEFILEKRSDQYTDRVMGQFGHEVNRRKQGFELLETLDGEVRVQATASFLKAIASRSVETALEHQSALGDPAARSASMLAILDQWAEKDPAAAVAKASEDGLEVDKDAAIDAILPRWIGRDPVAASEWVAAIPEDSPGRDTHIGSLVKGLTQTEQIPEALAWLEAMNNEAQQERVRSDLRDGMTEADFDEIQEYRAAKLKFSAERLGQYRRLYFGS